MGFSATVWSWEIVSGFSPRLAFSREQAQKCSEATGTTWEWAA